MVMSVDMRFPEGKAKALTLSYDDGVEQDIRLIQIMRENGVKGTFNLNSGLYAPEGTVYPAGQVHRRMTERQCLAAYAGSDIEVAVHASTHAFLEAVPTATAMMEVISDRAALEKAYGCIVRGMAYHAVGRRGGDSAPCGHRLQPHHRQPPEFRYSHGLAPSGRDLPSRESGADGAGREVHGQRPQPRAVAVLSVGSRL